MRKIAAVILIFGEIFSGNAAMADNPDPGKTEIAMDMHLTDGRTEIFVDDYPLFWFGEGWDDEASVITSLPLNSGLGPGRNEIVIRFWPGSSGLDDGPGLKLRFGYSEIGSVPDPFSDRPFAVLVHIKPDESAPGGFRLDRSVKGQPLLDGQLDSDLRQIAEGGFEVKLHLNVQIDLPEQEWKSGQILQNEATTRSELVSLMQRAYDAVKDGREGMLRELGPMLKRQAATLGMTLDQLMDNEYILFLDATSGFELQPFNASQSKLMIFGNGRLATLVPSPVNYVNEEAGESGSPLLVYWRDNNGRWQIIH